MSWLLSLDRLTSCLPGKAPGTGPQRIRVKQGGVGLGWEKARGASMGRGRRCEGQARPTNGASLLQGQSSLSVPLSQQIAPGLGWQGQAERIQPPAPPSHYSTLGGKMCHSLLLSASGVSSTVNCRKYFLRDHCVHPFSKHWLRLSGCWGHSCPSLYSTPHVGNGE